jgi:UDP-glucose 4-epimerase
MDDSFIAKRILLTGGRGCLAGVLGRYLESQGAVVTRLSRVAGDGFRSMDDFFAGRVAAPGDNLLHLAWSTVPYSAEQTPGLEQAQDMPLLERLLEKLASLPGAERPHFVFFSSGGGVYGDAHSGQPHRENDPCAPIGRHGQAKLAAERLLEETATRLGLAWTILRVSNPYGFPVPALRPQGFIPVAIRAAREGRPLTIWGDGTARKDFLHHSDFSRAVGQIILRRSVGTFNLCRGESHSLRELITLIEQATGRKIATLHRPAYEWDVHDSLLDNSKLRSVVNWRPAVSIEDGIRRAVAELPMT